MVSDAFNIKLVDDVLYEVDCKVRKQRGPLVVYQRPGAMKRAEILVFCR